MTPFRVVGVSAPNPVHAAGPRLAALVNDGAVRAHLQRPRGEFGVVEQSGVDVVSAARRVLFPAVVLGWRVAPILRHTAGGHDGHSRNTVSPVSAATQNTNTTVPISGLPRGRP